MSSLSDPHREEIKNATEGRGKRKEEEEGEGNGCIPRASDVERVRERDGE